MPKKLAPLVREISWTKNIIIMERCKEREKSGRSKIGEMLFM